MIFGFDQEHQNKISHFWEHEYNIFIIIIVIWADDHEEYYVIFWVSPHFVVYVRWNDIVQCWMWMPNQVSLWNKHFNKFPSYEQSLSIVIALRLLTAAISRKLSKYKLRKWNSRNHGKNVFTFSRKSFLLWMLIRWLLNT